MSKFSNIKPASLSPDLLGYKELFSAIVLFLSPFNLALHKIDDPTPQSEKKKCYLKSQSQFFYINYQSFSLLHLVL